MIKTCGESVLKIIIWRGGNKRKCTKVQKIKEGGGGHIHLIKLQNLKCNAHDKNYKMILAIGCIDYALKNFFFPPHD